MESESQKIKMAVIAGAAKALEEKQENPKLSEHQIIQKITDEIEEIISKIEE